MKATVGIFAGVMLGACLALHMMGFAPEAGLPGQPGHTSLLERVEEKATEKLGEDYEWKLYKLWR